MRQAGKKGCAHTHTHLVISLHKGIRKKSYMNFDYSHKSMWSLQLGNWYAQTVGMSSLLFLIFLSLSQAKFKEFRPNTHGVTFLDTITLREHAPIADQIKK